MAKTKRTPKKAGSGAKPSRTPPKPRAAKSGASAKSKKVGQSQTATGVPLYRSYGYGYGYGTPAQLRSAGDLSAASFGGSSSAPVRPLRMTHVGQSMLRAGIENWLKDLVRFLDRRRVQMVRCIATSENEIDPSVVAEMGAPVEVGGADCVRRAARDSDVLLCWGPPEL